MSVINKAFQTLGIANKPPKMETKTPALQAERESETKPEDITLGTDDTSGAKGKRGLVRPVASSLGGV